MTNNYTPQLKAFVFCFLLSLFSVNAFAQVGIGTTDPNASSVLDVFSTNKGVLFPNVNLLSETDAVTIASPAPGLMVYNTNTARPCGAGLYFNNGTAANPVWSCFTKTTMRYHAYNTAARTGVNLNNGESFVLQPGCLINFTVPVGQSVDVKIDAILGVINENITNNRYASFDTAIVVDGNFLDRGGYNRTTNVGTNSNNTVFENTYLSTIWENVGPGAHTIGLYVSYFEGNSPITIGGDCMTDVNCGEINAIVTYR